jgi:hypothetical protein
MIHLSDYDKEWCMKIHAELLKWPLTAPFRLPVDPIRDSAPRYFEITKNPMDLSTMKRKLTEGQYKSVSEFVDDFHLICDNAINFNGENSMLAFIAMDLKTWMNEQFKMKASSSEVEWHRKLTDVVNRLRDHVLSAPAAYTGLAANILTTAVTSYP